MVKENLNSDGNKINEIKTRTIRVRLDTEGFLRIVYVQGREVTLEDVEENVKALINICQGKKLPIYIIGPVKSISRDARIFLIKNLPNITTAVAILKVSPFIPVLTAFASTMNRVINKDALRLKIFGTEEKAITWLRNYLE